MCVRASPPPQFPASSLQLSFERSDDHQEFFLERLTARDVHHTNTGMRSVRVDRDHVPKYALKRRQQHQGDDKCALLANAADVLVKLHAWKGEEHLGVWQVGKLRGEVIYQVVD